MKRRLLDGEFSDFRTRNFRETRGKTGAIDPDYLLHIFFNEHDLQIFDEISYATDRLKSLLLFFDTSHTQISKLDADPNFAPMAKTTRHKNREVVSTVLFKNFSGEYMTGEFEMKDNGSSGVRNNSKFFAFRAAMPIFGKGHGSDSDFILTFLGACGGSQGLKTHFPTVFQVPQASLNTLGPIWENRFFHFLNSIFFMSSACPGAHSGAFASTI